MITDWRTAEHIAAAWVRRFGWEDAEITEDGRDNGIDVRAKGAVAQVKCWNHKRAGIKEVQRFLNRGVRYGAAVLALVRWGLLRAQVGLTPVLH